MSEESYYIRVLGDTSRTIFHENLSDCMEYFNVGSLSELSIDQLRKYCYKIGVLHEREQ